MLRVYGTEATKSLMSALSSVLDAMDEQIAAAEIERGRVDRLIDLMREFPTLPAIEVLEQFEEVEASYEG